MTPHVNIEAEQALLGALFLDDSIGDAVADLLRPEIFGIPAHREVAAEILALRAIQQPADPVLVLQRLQARQLTIAPDLVLGLARGVGVTGNARHYAEVLVDLWTKREARRIAAELLNLEEDLRGEELVARFAQQLSAIETRRGRPSQRLADLMLARLERREDFLRNPGKLDRTLWPTGFTALDSLVGGLRPGHLFTIAARPGVGKTAIVSAMVDHLAYRGVAVGILQLEDYADSIADRAIMRRASIPSVLMRDGAPWTAAHWDRAAGAVHDKADLPIWVDDQHQRTIGDLTGSMRAMAREHGIQVFVLDNLAEVVVDAQDRRDERLDRALGRIAKAYRDAAHAVGACPVLLVHLNRDLEKASGRPPRLSDIKNSGELEDASHVVALLSREKGSDQFQVDIAKNRNGPTGEVVLRWEASNMTVRNIEAA